jgi:hypothetical protein
MATAASYACAASFSSLKHAHHGQGLLSTVVYAEGFK